MDKVEVAVFIAFAILIIIVLCFASRTEGLNQPQDVARIITAIDSNQKNHGNIFTFRANLGDAEFSAYKYAKLVTLYKRGELSATSVRQVLS
ncbi:MAG: hypothetical protein WC887_03210 [Candidatus Paceibacterota bacterium]|jgi:hypothetical protein